MSSAPLVTIFGTTGVGKSQLAVELALHLSQHPTAGWSGARVINADAMQTYEGIDIITNKIPMHERKGVDHRLMSFKKPGEQYVVGQWVNDAINEIERAHAAKQLPIVVGGTAYWIQHLLFPNRLSKTSFIDDEASSTKTADLAAHVQQSVERLPPDLRLLFEHLPDQVPSAQEEAQTATRLYALLTALDPAMAERWHWKDTRKVLRSLEIVKETGRLPSEIVQEQSREVMQPRYHTLSFWLYAQTAQLHPRLDARVDQMLQQGMLDEIRQLRQIASAAGPDKDTSLDYTLGIYQSIGYKDLNTYLDSEEPNPECLERSVEAMKSSTRQYAKRQVSWIRNKLLPALEPFRDVMPSYLLDATDVREGWDEKVRGLGVKILDDFLCKNPLPDPLCLSEVARDMLAIGDKPTNPQDVLVARRKRVCSICTTEPDRPVQIEEGVEWDRHIRSKSHHYHASKEEREAKKQAMIAQREEKRRARQILRSGPESQLAQDRTVM